MVSLLASMPGAIAYGIIWGIMAIGVYITFRVLDVADLTVDGSMATGGIVLAVLAECILYYLPVFSFISDGFKVILATVFAASVGASLFPVASREEYADDENGRAEND